jgi:transcriptional regulator with XRE-family HTH domain
MTAAGRVIREAREALGLTQDDLVAALFLREMSVTRQAVSSWERGRTVPRLPVRVAVFQILGITDDPYTEDDQ